MGDLEHLIPTFANMKTVLTRKKIKLRPALPVNIASIILTGIYLTIIRSPSDLNTKFLLYAGPSNSMLVFCSRIGLEVLSKCTSMHGDGTFYVAAKYFYQLYLLHGWYNYYIVEKLI